MNFIWILNTSERTCFRWILGTAKDSALSKWWQGLGISGISNLHNWSCCEVQLLRPREPATPCSGFLARCHHTTAWTAFPLFSTLQASRQMQLCNSFALGKSKRKLQKDSKYSFWSPPCPPFDTLTLWHSHLILCNRQTSRVYPFILWIKRIFCLLSLLPSRELFLAFRLSFILTMSLKQKHWKSLHPTYALQRLYSSYTATLDSSSVGLVGCEYADKVLLKLDKSLSLSGLFLIC